MSSLPQMPTEQEIEAMVEKITDTILNSRAFLKEEIVQYGFFVGQGVKPPAAVLSGFYRAFSALARTPDMQDYSLFVKRFGDNEAALSAFEDQIAARSYIRTISRLSVEKLS